MRSVIKAADNNGTQAATREAKATQSARAIRAASFSANLESQARQAQWETRNQFRSNS